MYPVTKLAGTLRAIRPSAIQMGTSKLPFSCARACAGGERAQDRETRMGEGGRMLATPCAARYLTDRIKEGIVGVGQEIEDDRDDEHQVPRIHHRREGRNDTRAALQAEAPPPSSAGFRLAVVYERCGLGRLYGRTLGRLPQ